MNTNVRGARAGVAKRVLEVLTVLLVSISPALAQLTSTGSLATHIDSIITSLPTGNGTGEYQAPNSTQLTQWGTIITNILQGQYATAHTNASALGYQLVQFLDTSQSPDVTYYILERQTSSSNYWGVFVFNPTAVRPKLAIQAVHPLHDLKSGKQARYVFQRNGALAFFMSGTHRCNSPLYSTCSGTTDACSDTTANYRVSDQAHVTSGTFQRATEIMRTSISGLIVIQPHGFSRTTGDPDIIMGNGTQNSPSGVDYLVALRDNLLLQDPALTFKIAHIDTDWDRLTGTTNTQGRLINGSSNPCSNNVFTPNGRFLHLEQVYTGLRDTEANWNKLSNAVGATFAADGLVLSSPNGGESWDGGSSHSITWTSTGSVSNVKLEYTVDNGATWSTIIASVANSGSYAWTVPAIGSWRARVRITSTANPVVTDVSASNFKIVQNIWPVSGTTTPDPMAATFGPRMLSGVYDFHRGIDLPNALNTPVHPAKAGLVVRFEDTTQTIGTARERYGNWILVQHEPVGGEPRHTAYLHLNSFAGYSVGDTVSTRDTIAFMGKSGVGINTIHVHVEYYKNLTGTAIDNDKAMHPLEVLEYPDNNSYGVSFSQRNDSSGVEISMTEPELDFDRITLYGALGSRTVAINARTGIDPSNNDNPAYNGVFIEPSSFTIDSTTQRLRFWTKNSEVGEVDSIEIADINGFTRIHTDSSGDRYAVVSGNWTGPIWAASPGGAAGSAPAPTGLDDIHLLAGVVVTVSSPGAECRSVIFEAATSQFILSSGAILSVYGNFTLFSTTHAAFSSWASGAKLRFAGPSAQTLSGWSTTSSTTANTTLMEVVVDKTAGSVATPGTDMKLSLGTSLVINGGEFLLNADDDINGKTFDGSGAATPAITVNAAGSFRMQGGTCHIRSGSSGSLQIGVMTVYGSSTVTTSSSLGINFGNINVESGGTLTLSTGWSANKLQPGILTVRNGGTLSNTTTSNVWTAGASVNLQPGGLYKTTSSTTVFPALFTNAGTVRYARTTGDGSQTVTDMDYNRLEISYAGNKSWDLAANRVVADSLETNNSATLVLTAASARTLSVGNVLRLTSGLIDNSNANASLVLADGVLISRATGEIAQPPVFGAHVDVRYSSSASAVTTGPELPPAGTVLRNLEIIAPAGVALGSSALVNGQLELARGLFFLGANNLTIGSTATVAGSPADTAMVVTNGTGRLMKRISSIPASFEYPIGDTTGGAPRLTGVLLEVLTGSVVTSGDIGVRVSGRVHPLNSNPENILARYWSIDAAGITSIGYNATFEYLAADVIGLEQQIVLGRWDTLASSWIPEGSVNPALHRLTGMLHRFSEFTGVPAVGGVAVVDGWNLISAPLMTSDMRTVSLFPASIPPAYRYRNGYAPSETLEIGTGYWLKFGAIDTVPIQGTPVLRETVAVRSGWNMVGSLTVPVPATSVTPLGGILLLSPFYGYDAGYSVADTLEPGKGYWVKSSATGYVDFNPSALAPPELISTPQFRPDDGTYNSLRISSTGDRRSSSLYFGHGAESGRVGELPPLPPGNAFDVRFGDGTQVVHIKENLSGVMNVPIRITGAGPHLTISWEIRDETEAALLAGAKRIELKGSGSVTLTGNQESLSLVLGEDPTIPSSFVLRQNYPNPFNPVTEIVFGIPIRSYVKLSVYSTFGQHVATLVDGVQDAGFRTVRWDATGHASGVYYYRLEGGSAGVLTQKMVLVR